MSVSANNSSPLQVSIAVGNALPAAPTIVSAAYNAASQQVVLTMSDGTQIPIPGFAQALAQALGGQSLAVCDSNGALILGGKPRLGVSADGYLTAATPLPDTSNGYAPVSGSGVLYQNGSGPIQEA